MMVYISNSQSIIWEKENKFDFIISTSTNPVLLDSDGYIVNLLESTSYLQSYSYFLKSNTDGDFLELKELYSPLMTLINKIPLRIPITINQSDDGYKIFAGTSSSLVWNGSEKLLPIIINIDKNGDTAIINKPYDINIKSNYSDFGIVKSSVINTVAAGQMFFNGYVNRLVQESENVFVQNYHIVIGCYDSLGKMLWRKGYDSLGAAGNSYSLQDIKATQFGTVMVLLHKYHINGIDWDITKLKLIEIDYNGNVVNRFDISQNNTKFYPMEVIRLDNGDYCFLNEYLTYHFGYFLWKVNSNGEIINQIDIPDKNIKKYLYKLRLSNDGNLILLGEVVIDKKIPDDPFDDIAKLYMVKMSKDFDVVWEYESEPDISFNMQFRELINLTGNDFIVTGYKNKYNFYIAKFRDLITTVDDIKFKKDVELFHISPNPASDFISVRYNTESESKLRNSKIMIYSLLGNKVLETGFSNIVDVRNLVAGIYYLSIGTDQRIFVKN